MVSSSLICEGAGGSERKQHVCVCVCVWTSAERVPSIRWSLPIINYYSSDGRKTYWLKQDFCYSSKKGKGSPITSKGRGGMALWRWRLSPLHRCLIFEASPKEGSYSFATTTHAVGWENPDTASKGAAVCVQSNRPQRVWPADVWARSNSRLLHKHTQKDGASTLDHPVTATETHYYSWCV